MDINKIIIEKFKDKVDEKVLKPIIDDLIRGQYLHDCVFFRRWDYYRENIYKLIEIKLNYMKQKNEKKQKVKYRRKKSRNEKKRKKIFCGQGVEKNY